jgi:hypothetical protein
VSNLARRPGHGITTGTTMILTIVSQCCTTQVAYPIRKHNRQRDMDGSIRCSLLKLECEEHLKTQILDNINILMSYLTSL